MATGKKKTIFPPALKQGDTIGIMAPSTRVSRQTVNDAAATLRDLGFEVYIHPQTFNRLKQSAGTPQAKAAALHDLFRDKNIKAIFAAGGGNRATTLMPHLDMDVVRKNPKIIMGFSDVTALLNGISRNTGLVTFHGPTMGRFNRPIAKAQVTQCFNMLNGTDNAVPMPRATVLKAGSASGRMVGGNLSLVVSLLGTPWEPDFDGAILFLEDCNEEKSRIDRMLVQLDNAGVFNRISGFVAGQFSDTTDTGRTPFGFTLNDILKDRLAGRKIPSVMNAPFGHDKDLYTFPVGATATLTARKGKSTLTFGPTVR